MTWGGKKLSEDEIDLMYLAVFNEGMGPVVLTHLIAEECHLYDEISSEPELVALQNLGKRILKRLGVIREDRLVDITRRLIGVLPPESMREEKDR